MSSVTPSRLAEVLRSEALPGLDGLRAISVLLVIAYHAGYPLPARLGVSAFFVISGFLITWLLLREVDRTETIDLRAFYMRRSLRIFPAYYAFLAVSLLADHVVGDKRSLDAALPALFYVLNYYNAVHDHPSISIAHAWSLAIEEQFYLLWPALLLLMRRWSLQAIATALSCFVVAVILWRTFVYLGTDLGTSWIYNAFDTRADNLAVGCLMAVGVTAWSRSRTLDAVVYQPLALIPSVLLLGVLVYLPSETWRYTIGFTFEAMLLALITLQGICLSSQGSARVLQWQPMIYVGRLSYGMYLYHVLSLAVASKILGLFHSRSTTSVFCLGLLITLVVSSASYHWYESFFLRLRGRFRYRDKSRTLGDVGDTQSRLLHERTTP